MIIWISGAYGVGKSTLAEVLEKRIENALIFDAEEVGNAVRENYPDCPYGFVFEDYPLWAEFCYKLLKDVHEKFGRNILVPMTMLRRASYTNIIEKLISDGIDVRFVVLEASYESVHDRILARGEEEGCWCMENIEMARENAHAIKEGIHITTDGKSVDEIANIVLAEIKEGVRNSVENKVQLVELTEENWLSFARLSVEEEQKAFLAPPTGIIARGYVYRDCNARVWGITDGKQPIGLALVRDQNEEPVCYDLQQFMIDRSFQNRGFGTAALRKILSICKEERRFECVEVCVNKADSPALHVYEKVGFIDTGYIDDDLPDCLNLMYHFD